MMKFNKLLCWHLKNHAMAWSEINDAKTIPRPVIWNSIMLYSTYIAGTTTKQQHNNSRFQQMISSLAFLDSKCYYATSIVKVRNTCCSQYVELKLSYCAQLKNACLLIKKELLESVPGFCQQGEGVPLKKIECA